MKSNVKAFTILEMTIAMLVSGRLVIAITYASYSIVVKSHHDFNVKHDEHSLLISFDHALTRDFDEATLILQSENGVTIQKSNEIIAYEFKPEAIVRHSARIDTFAFTTTELNRSYQNTPLPESPVDKQLNMIDRLDFILLFHGDKIPYVYTKLYSASQLMQKNNDAGN